MTKNPTRQIDAIKTPGRIVDQLDTHKTIEVKGSWFSSTRKENVKYYYYMLCICETLSSRLLFSSAFVEHQKYSLQRGLKYYQKNHVNGL